MQLSSADQLAIENLRRYLQIPTVHPHPNYFACADFFREMAASIGLELSTVTIVPDKPIFVFVFAGKDQSAPSLMLNSHMDVVPASRSGWDWDPFEAHVRENGDIVARGAQDMKSMGIGYLEAVRRLKKQGFQPFCNVIVTFVPDEEIGGGDGMSAFVQSQEFRRMNVGVVIDEGIPASGSKQIGVYYSERIPYWVKAIATGPTGHGSTLLQGTAVEKLIRFLDRAYCFRAEQQKKLFQSGSDLVSINVTGLEGGTHLNVIPETVAARLVLDIRLPHTVSAEEFDVQLASFAKGTSVTFERLLPDSNLGHYSSDHKQSRPWIRISQAISACGIEVSPLIFPGATDSRFIRPLGIPAYGICPFLETPALLHGHNEFINGAIFIKGVGIYAEIIKSLSDGM